MKTRFKDLLLGIILGLSLSVVYVSRSLIEEISLTPLQFGWSSQTHPLTGKSNRPQLQSVVRMTVANDTDTQLSDSHTEESSGSLNDNDLEDRSIADRLSKQVRVLIWVMTSPKTLQTKAQTIKETWGKRPNVVIYFSSVANKSFPAVGLDVPEGRAHLTAKTMAAFRYLYENHMDDADWFMKADDDTYVIVENLRLFLSTKDTNSPIYFGHLFKLHVEQGYYSGGSGYVLSKEALRRFGKFAINSTVCSEDGPNEDLDMGICMEKLGVKSSMSLDEQGRTLFHPHHPQKHLLGSVPAWHYRYTAGVTQKGFGVSKYAVTFHYVDPDEMRTLDYFFYHIRPYGIHSTVRQQKQVHGDL